MPTLLQAPICRSLRPKLPTGCGNGDPSSKSGFTCILAPRRWQRAAALFDEAREAQARDSEGQGIPYMSIGIPGMTEDNFRFFRRVGHWFNMGHHGWISDYRRSTVTLIPARLTRTPQFARQSIDCCDPPGPCNQQQLPKHALHHNVSWVLKHSPVSKAPHPTFH